MSYLYEFNNWLVYINPLIRNYIHDHPFICALWALNMCLITRWFR